MSTTNNHFGGITVKVTEPGGVNDVIRDLRMQGAALVRRVERESWADARSSTLGRFRLSTGLQRELTGTRAFAAKEQRHVGLSTGDLESGFAVAACLVLSLRSAWRIRGTSRSTRRRWRMATWSRASREMVSTSSSRARSAMWPVHCGSMRTRCCWRCSNLRSRLDVENPAGRFRLVLYHDTGSGQSRYFEKCTTVRFESDLSDPRLFTYSVLIHASSPDLVTAVLSSFRPGRDYATIGLTRMSRRILHHGPDPDTTPTEISDRAVAGCWFEWHRQGGCGSGELRLRDDFANRGRRRTGRLDLD